MMLDGSNGQILPDVILSAAKDLASRTVGHRSFAALRMTMCAMLCAVVLGSAPVADQPTVIVVVGAEGTPEYGSEFGKWADRWKEAASRGSARFILLGKAASGTISDKDQLKALLEAEAKLTTPPLWLVLIGHGTFDGREAKFNLRGGDVSAAELAEWVKPIKRPLAVAACFSASAPFVNALSAEGRIVLTATQSGREVQFSRFGDYLSAAITDPSADLDKDGQTSLLEAYLAASHRVAEFYRQESRLATEHALLDDNGDTLGTPASWFQGIRATKSARDGATLDGSRAHQWHLVPSRIEAAMSPEQRARRDELELKIEALRSKKGRLSEEQYYDELQRLLIELARVYER